MTARLTILRDARTARGAPSRAAKLLEYDAGKLVARGYGRAFTFVPEVAEVADLDALHRLLCDLERDPHACVIRGRPLAPGVRGPRRLHERQGRHRRAAVERPTIEEDADCRWLCLDLDAVQAPESFHEARRLRPGGVPNAKNLAELALWARDSVLPACFRGARGVWQWSSSAGLKGWSLVRGHLWLLVDRALDVQDAKRWLREWPVDAALLSPAQVHYTAAPVLGDGVPDPLAGAPRTILLTGDRDIVALPERLPTVAQGRAQRAEAAAREMAEREARAARLAALPPLERAREEAAARAAVADADEDTIARILRSQCRKIRERGPDGVHGTLRAAAYWLGGLRGLDHGRARDALLGAMAREPRDDDRRTVTDMLAKGALRPWSPRERDRRAVAPADPDAEPDRPPPTARRRLGNHAPLGLRDADADRLLRALERHADARLVAGDEPALIARYLAAGERLCVCGAAYSVRTCSASDDHPPEGEIVHMCEIAPCPHCGHQRARTIADGIASAEGVEVALPLPLDAPEGTEAQTTRVAWPEQMVVVHIRPGTHTLPPPASAARRNVLRAAYHAAAKGAGVERVYRTVAGHEDLVVVLPDHQIHAAVDARDALREIGLDVTARTMRRAAVARLVAATWRSTAEVVGAAILEARDAPTASAADAICDQLAASAALDPDARRGPRTTASRAGVAMFPWPSEARIRAQLVAEAVERRGGLALDRCSHVDPTTGAVCGAKCKTISVHHTGALIRCHPPDDPAWEAQRHAALAAVAHLREQRERSTVLQT